MTKEAIINNGGTITKMDNESEGFNRREKN